MNKKKLDELLGELQIELRQLFPERLQNIYLYGSQARGDARPYSDIDVLVVLEGEFDYFQMIQETGEVTARLSLKNDVVLALAFVSTEDYARRNTPFLQNVRREAIPV